MSFTKRQLVEAAYGELALAAYTFDLSPDEIQAGLQRIEGMLRTWKNQGIDTGYAFPLSPAVSDPDDSSGMLDFYEEAVRTNGAIRIAPLFGKTVSAETRLAASLAYQSMLVGRPVPVMQLPRNLPVGAGNRWGGADPGYFTPCLPAGVSDPSVSSQSPCDCKHEDCCSLCIDEVTKILLENGSNLVGFNPTADAVRGTIGWHAKSQAVNVTDFPWNCTGDGSDNIQALQAAIDFAAGRSVYIPKGTYGISDTLYIPPGTTIFGDGPGDNWAVTSSEKGTRIKTIGAGVLRIWTDVGLPDTPAGTLVDAPMSVAVVITGSGCTIKDLALEGGSQTDGSDAWGAGFFNASVRRTSMSNVETLGRFKRSGMYIDATWSNTNTALQSLHANTYGRAVPSDQASNEFSADNCWFQGGNWGVYIKSTVRSDTSANIWSPGGVSDLMSDDVRVGNTPIGIAPNFPEDSGAYYRDVLPGFQNRYWVGCSFRSSSAYAVFLDRGRRESFEAYGEARPERCVTMAVNYVVDSLPITASLIGGTLYRKIYLTKTTRIDPLVEGARPGATFTSGATSFVAYAFGFDATAGRAYIVTTSSAVTAIAAGSVVSQAAGQTAAQIFYATERAASTRGSGAIGFISPTLDRIYFGNDSISLGSNNFRAGQSSITIPESLLSANDETNINCENGTQINLWINKFGSGVPATYRMRYFGTSLESYNIADLGSAVRPWGGAYLTTLNVAGKDITPIIGTWTPVLRGSTIAGTNVYSTQLGRVTKIGNRAFVSGMLAVSGSVDPAMAGTIQISGLPYPVFNDAAAWVSVDFARVQNINLTAATQLVGQVSGGATTITLIERGNTGDATLTSPAKFAANFQIRFAFSYEVAN